MSEINTVSISGRLTKNPAIRKLPGTEMSFTVLSIAQNVFKGANAPEESNFFDINIFGKDADNAGRFLQKGSPILVESKLVYEKWIGSDGKNKSRNTLMGQRVIFARHCNGKVNTMLMTGNMTRDPERREAGGTVIVNLSFAQNVWNKRTQKEEVHYFTGKIFGKQAEYACRVLKKGSKAFMCGKYRQEKWKDRNTGQERRRMEFIIDNFEALTKVEKNIEVDTSTPYEEEPSGFMPESMPLQ